MSPPAVGPEPQHPLLELVAVMDRLRSPGGCPWDAEQTHESLVQYLLEECYETIDAIHDGDEADLREELGDLLLQVVFHARIAGERDPGWGIEDVAQGIVDKLVRRHPHVFADTHAADAAEVAANWTLLKAAEKSRSSALDGIPPGLPALSLAQKTMRRAADAGVPVRIPAADCADPDELAERLLALAAAAEERGWDAESLLRRRARELQLAVVNAEGSAPQGTG